MLIPDCLLFVHCSGNHAEYLPGSSNHRGRSLLDDLKSVLQHLVDLFEKVEPVALGLGPHVKDQIAALLKRVFPTAVDQDFQLVVEDVAHISRDQRLLQTMRRKISGHP